MLVEGLLLEEDECFQDDLGGAFVLADILLRQDHNQVRDSPVHGTVLLIVRNLE